jgi:ADP-ribose pyrophosphatase YjhB (NUDIX family)
MNNYGIRIRVAAVLIENKKILLIAHRNNNSVYWLLPGGGVNPCESLEQALVRELKEELNIFAKVNDIALVCDSIAPDESKHIVNICFFCTRNSGKYFLCREQRLYDFSFYAVDELDNLQIIPPIRIELKNILNGYNNYVYQGRRWVEQ